MTVDNNCEVPSLSPVPSHERRLPCAVSSDDFPRRRQVWRGLLLLVMASMVFAMGARRPEGAGGCGGGQPTPRQIQWTDILRSTTITPLEHEQTSSWSPAQVDEFAGTLDSPSGRDFSNHAGVYGLRWWGDEDSVLVLVTGSGGFERGSSRFPESIREVRSVDIGECSTDVPFDNPSNPSGALAQMIDQGLVHAIRDQGGPWTHVDLETRSAFWIRLRQQPAEAGFDFPPTGLLANDDFCFDGHYRLSRIGINGRCVVGRFRLHFCGRPTVQSRWEDFDNSALPSGQPLVAGRVQVGDFDFSFTEPPRVREDAPRNDGCNVGDLPSSEGLAASFSEQLPPKIAEALNDQTWQDAAALGSDVCAHFPRSHPDWTDAEVAAACASAWGVQADRIRCGGDVSASAHATCQFRAEPDRVAFLPSRMVIVLAECAGAGGLADNDPTSSCSTPDPQRPLFKLVHA